jgi:hypothetical protein
MYKKESMRDLFSGCASKTGITLTAPLKIPLKWSRVLRLAPAYKLNPNEVVQVSCSWN